jgi:hypothetical protein
MNNYLSPIIDALFATRRYNPKDQLSSKSIIDLAITAHLNGKTIAGATTKPITPTPPRMDSKFKNFTINQVKGFLYSGHDTTSATLCYVFYLLSKHPAALSKLRAEHTTVFSSPPSNARNPTASSTTSPNINDSALENVPATAIVTATMISKNPYHLNRLPYTNAVIKEALRLFPPTSTNRAGSPSVTIKDPISGLAYPTSGFLINLTPHSLHHNPTYFPRPSEFLPERWLVPSSDPLSPKPGTWRPFEQGPRACIGQELAMLTLKTVLCLVVRGFEISPAYEEIDQGREKEGIRMAKEDVEGERAYQGWGGGPWGGLPCRVQVVEGEERGRR